MHQIRLVMTSPGITPNVQKVSQNLRNTVSSPETFQGTKNESDWTSASSLAVGTLSKDLANKTERVETVSAYLAELTWINIENEEVRQTITDLLKLSHVWYNSELEYMKAIQPVIKNGAGEKEFNAYKEAIEDLDEAIADLTSAIITLPASKEFNDAMNELSNL